MEYEPKIKIRSRITDDEGDNRMEITADAKISGTETDFSLEYDESIVPSCITHTEIKVTDGNTVSVIRRGEMSHEITAEEGKRHICHYSMPFGEIVFGVYGKRVKCDVGENGGTLELEYELNYPNGMITVNEMIIEIYPKGAGINE